MSIVRLRPAKGRPRSPLAAPPVEGQVRVLRLHRRLAIIGAAIGLVVGVVAFLPASLVAGAVAQATDDQFLLAEADGTVWDGSALTVLTGGRDSRDASVLPTRLQWHLRPRWNGIALHLSQDCCLAHGVDLGVRRGVDGWRIDVIGPDEASAPAARVAQTATLAPAAPTTPTTPTAPVTLGADAADATAMTSATPLGQWPLGWLVGRGFPWNTMQPGGLLTLTTRHLSFALRDGQWRSRGSAQVEIRQASSRLAPLPTLGSYRVLIQPDTGTEKTPGDGATRALVWISTLDGALRIDGRGIVGPGGMRLRAEAHAAAGSEAALENLLNLIGRRNGALSVISIG